MSCCYMISAIWLRCKWIRNLFTTHFRWHSFICCIWFHSKWIWIFFVNSLRRWSLLLLCNRWCLRFGSEWIWNFLPCRTRYRNLLWRSLSSSYFFGNSQWLFCRIHLYNRLLRLLDLLDCIFLFWYFWCRSSSCRRLYHFLLLLLWDSSGSFMIFM